jgi:hypothetical protein
MGGKDFRRREKKKPKKETRKVSGPTFTSEAEQVDVIQPKSKKEET